MLADCKSPHPPPWQSKGIALIKKNNHHIHCQVNKKERERERERKKIAEREKSAKAFYSFIYLFF